MIDFRVFPMYGRRFIQNAFQEFFKKDSTLMWMIVIASALWITNAVFDLAAIEYEF